MILKITVIVIVILTIVAIITAIGGSKLIASFFMALAFLCIFVGFSLEIIQNIRVSDKYDEVGKYVYNTAPNSIDKEKIEDMLGERIELDLIADITGYNIYVKNYKGTIYKCNKQYEKEPEYDERIMKEIEGKISSCETKSEANNEVYDILKKYNKRLSLDIEESEKSYIIHFRNPYGEELLVNKI